jgi:hypothetical protein
MTPIRKRYADAFARAVLFTVFSFLYLLGSTLVLFSQLAGNCFGQGCTDAFGLIALAIQVVGYPLVSLILFGRRGATAAVCVLLVLAALIALDTFVFTH